MKVKALLLVSASATCLALADFRPAQASIFDDAGIYPGQVIVNTVTGTSSYGALAPASASLTIGNLPISGKLRTFLHAGSNSGSPAAVQTFPFSRSDYSTGDASGPFVASGNPVDRSGATAQTIAIGQPLPVQEVTLIRQGVPVFLVLEAAALNTRSGEIESTVVMVADSATGDVEFLRLYETAPNSGVFSGWFNTAGLDLGTSRDGTMGTTENSTISAELGEAGEIEGDELRTLIEVALPNPSNTVFDSANGAPINGATIRIINAQTGNLAAAFGENLRSSYPSEIVSGQDTEDGSGTQYDMGAGQFRFPYLPAGRYRIEVDAPAGYQAPSIVSDSAIDDLAMDYDVGPGSRLRDFTIGPGEVLDFDIPVDRIAGGNIVRISEPSIVEVGDIFRFEVTMDTAGLAGIDIEDQLPPGMRFLAGSMTINGAKVTPVLDKDGRVLRLSNFPSPASGEILVKYAAQILPGVDPSMVLRSSSVISEALTGRNRSEGFHDLRLLQAFDLADVTIMGDIRISQCGTQVDDHDYDLSGIRVLLESGDYAVSDEKGRFHFRDIAHRPHVVQVDKTTLPRHSKLVLCNRNTRSAGSAASQFVDVRPGMMGRVEFHLEFDQAAMAAEDAAAKSDNEYDEKNPASRFTQAWLDARGEVARPEILTPDNLSQPYATTVDVMILRRPGERSEITVNGKPIDPIYRDQGLTSANGRAEIDRFRALRLEEGRNRIEVVVFDKSGSEILRETREVLMAESFSHVELLSRGSSLESDGRTSPVLRYQLRNEDGIPLRPGLKVQVAIEKPFAFMPSASRDSQRASEMKPQQSVTAIVRENGEIELRLAPVLNPGMAKISVPSGDKVIRQDVWIEAPERPWVLVGLAEGTLAERHVREHMRRSGDISNDLNGRVSLFAEGVVKGSWLLTLRLDTAKDGSGEFDGIDPDKDYVVYGDRSWQDDASPSRFPLYLRLQREGAEFLVGDFDTDIETDLISLNRKMTGMRAMLENDKFRVMGFAAESAQRYVEDRIAVDGTVGPYELSRRDIVARSETVRLIRLSRLDAAEELDSQELVAGQDYVISYTSGEIMLRKPTAAFSSGMERYVLEVTYETDEEIEAGVVAGIRAEANVSKRLRLGATALHEKNSEGLGVDVTLLGLDLGYQVNDDLRLSAELVQSLKDDGRISNRGTSGEIRAEYDDGSNIASAYFRKMRGKASLDADMDLDRVDTLGLEFSAFIDGPTASSFDEAEQNRKERIGAYLEGLYIDERRRSFGGRSQRGELLYVQREKDIERAFGITGEDESDGYRRETGYFWAGRSEWKINDFTFGLGLEYALKNTASDAKDKLGFSITYDLSETADIFLNWDGTSRRDSGAIAGVVSAGMRFDNGSGGDATIGIAQATADGRSGQSIFAGGNQEINLNENLTAEFGVDGQRDLGAADVPVGLSFGESIIEDSFLSARSAMRYSEKTWSAGIDAEHRWADIGDRGNVRLSMDGMINDYWSIGADGIIGRSNENDSPEEDSRIRVSLAYRRESDDPLHLIGLEYHNEQTEGGRNAKIYANWLSHRYLTDRDQVTLRYALKYQWAGVDAGTYGDFTHLAGMEFRHDFTEKLDMGFHISGMHGVQSGNSELSAGVSMGFTPFENGWVSVGYNFTGFEDVDFSKNGETGKGAFVQFRMKFDGDVLKKMFR